MTSHNINNPRDPRTQGCRCDCVSCVTGEHAGCYYATPEGVPECGLIEPISKAIHRCFFHEDEDSPRVDELYQESKRQMIRMAQAAIRSYESCTEEERKQARK